MNYDISQILKLPTADRLQIISDISQSIDHDHLEVPEWQKQELMHREELHKKNPDSGMSWKDFRKTLEQS